MCILVISSHRMASREKKKRSLTHSVLAQKSYILPQHPGIFGTFISNYKKKKSFSKFKIFAIDLSQICRPLLSNII